MIDMIDIGRMPTMHWIRHIRQDTGLDPMGVIGLGLILGAVLFSKFPAKGKNAKDYR